MDLLQCLLSAMSILSALIVFAVVISISFENGAAFEGAGIPIQNQIGWLGTTNETRPALVESFASLFIRVIQADPKMKSAFDLSLLGSPENARNIYYDIVLKGNLAVGDPYASIPAVLVSDAVYSNFYRITPDNFIAICAYAAGNFLFLQGALTSENVEELSRARSEGVFEEVRDNIYSVVAHSEDDNVRAIARGYIGCLTLNRFLRRETTGLLAVCFSDILYKL